MPKNGPERDLIYARIEKTTSYLYLLSLAFGTQFREGAKCRLAGEPVRADYAPSPRHCPKAASFNAAYEPQSTKSELTCHLFCATAHAKALKGCASTGETEVQTWGFMICL